MKLAMCARLLTVLEFSSSWNVTCAHGWQGGGGLYIWGTGTATLTNTNVYENEAEAWVLAVCFFFHCLLPPA